MSAQMLLQYFAGGGSLYHGMIINDTSGQPAAVVTGSYASGGALPWNIRGRRVWIAVALAARRGVDQSWNL